MLSTLVALAALLAAPAQAGHDHGRSHEHSELRCSCDAHQPQRPSQAWAKVSVRNSTGRAVDLYADGVYVQSLPPGSSELRLRPGLVNLSARVEGRVIERLSYDLAPRQELMWRVDAPSIGQLLIRNPLPMAVNVIGPDGLAYDIPAYGEITLRGVPVGWASVTVRRPGGGLLETRSVEVNPWDLSAMSVRPPSTGLVYVDNDLHRPLRVFVDGRPTSHIAGDGRLTLELAPGFHRVDLVDDNGRYAQTVRSFGVDVDLYAPSRLEIDRPMEPQRPNPGPTVSVSVHGHRSAR
ncbi:MAG: hypothetical protein H6741_31575 [Alphaproteobacteria bacterium]|nr:hypothetical protein [Alphaproteobacteria bacterium]